MTRAVIVLSLLSASLAAGLEVDIFGYFEPQYYGLLRNGHYSQLQTDKLRVDLEHTATRGVEVGADLIGLLAFGRTEWDLLDYVPDRLDSVIPPEARGLYRLSYEDRYYLDNAYVRLSYPRLAATVGKQQLSFGTGYFANPTDPYNAKDALDPTYEQPGHNALRLDLQPAGRVTLTAVYGPLASDWRGSGKLVRLKAGLGHFDFSLTGIEFEETLTDFLTFEPATQRRHTVGADLVGELAGLGVWAEGAGSFPEAGDRWYEFICGADYTIEPGLHFLAEYHRNSRAKPDWQAYDLNDWLRYLSGQYRTLGRDQLYASVRYPLTDVLGVGVLGAACLDASAAIVPTIEYSLFENVALTLMLNVFVGREGTAFGRTFGSAGLVRCRAYF